MNRVTHSQKEEIVKILKGRPSLVKKDPKTGEPVWTKSFLERAEGYCCGWDASEFAGTSTLERLQKCSLRSSEIWGWFMSITRICERLEIAKNYIGIERPDLFLQWEEDGDSIDEREPLLETLNTHDPKGDTVPLPTAEEKASFLAGEKLQEPFYKYVLGWDDWLVDFEIEHDSFGAIHEEIESSVRLTTDPSEVPDILSGLCSHAEWFFYLFFVPRLTHPKLFPNDACADFAVDNDLVESFGWILFDGSELARLDELKNKAA